MSDRQRTVDRWLVKARRDLLTARTMLEIDDPPTDVICFHCQQAVEKHLKAFLVRHDRDIPKTHDLPHLIALCATHCPDLASIEDGARSLTDYAVETRYVDDWRDIPLSEAWEAVAVAERLMEFIGSRTNRETTP